MKSNFSRIVSGTVFSLFLFNAGISFSQGGVTPGDQKVAKSEEAKPSLKGEFTKQSNCVDVVVKKGCINYKLVVDKVADNVPVKLCSDAKTPNKKHNICRKGAKRITVKYEKTDVNTIVEFPTQGAADVMKPKENN